MKIREVYTYAGKPAELVKISSGAQVAVYLIQVGTELISTCCYDRRFRVHNVPVREVRV
jgi:hypothetical protein